MEGRLSGPLAAALAEREYSTRLPQARQDASLPEENLLAPCAQGRLTRTFRLRGVEGKKGKEGR